MVQQLRWVMVGLICAVWLSPAQAMVTSCLLEPSKDVELGTPVEGVLTAVNVDRSDVVAQGDVLARLNRAVELAELEVATARRDFTRRHWERTESLGAQRMISDQEVDEIRTDYELAEGELRRVRAALALRSVRSPFDGVIVERHFDRGDVVRGEPIFRLLSLDPLYVEVVMTVRNFGLIATGDQFRIQIPDLDQEMVAEVIVVDRVVDPRSSTFRVRLELPNADLSVPSGLQCEWLGPA